MIIKRISPLVQAIIVVGLVLLLGVIGWYGGPPQTVPLGMGSPAIDQAVSAACPALDQRGYERQSACDIGPFEYHELVLGLKKRIYLPVILGDR
jgi:hypothetical protein